MKTVLLNSNLEIVGDLDIFKSFLWTDRFQEFGDFEIVEFPQSNILAMLIEAKYLLLEESEHVMVIETLRIRTDPVNGNELIIIGKSAESFLNRRIVNAPTILSGNLQDGIQLILNENAITPTVSARDIPELEFLASTDPIITALTVELELLGETLYDVISSLCVLNGIGFKITLTDANKFRFQLYAGVDRSYDQETNPYVVFSLDFDNLLNGDYYISDETLKTYALVAGEAGVGNIRTFAEVEYPTGLTGLERREIFVDAQSVTRTSYGEGEPLTDEEYGYILEDKGYEELSNNQSIQTFEGQLESSTMYVYGEDFFMGDIVQVANEYGHEATSRVIEMVYFQDSSGTKMVPTFKAV